MVCSNNLFFLTKYKLCLTNLEFRCSNASISFEKIFTLNNPYQIARSKQLTLSTNVVMNCYESFTYAKRWYIYQLDETTKQIKNEIDLANNPTFTLSELVLRENTLDYGLFKAVHEINTTCSVFTFFSRNETFFRIRPSGLFVFGIQNAVTSILIGSDQRFYLNASNYSIDYDEIINPADLNYRYYCKTLDLTNQSYEMQIIDLYSFQANSSLVMNRNKTCFSSSCKKIYYVIKVLYLCSTLNSCDI